MSPEEKDPKRPADGLVASGGHKHPVRLLIAGLLGDRPMSANDLAEVVEMKPSAIRRHLREMRAANVIEVVDVRRRRGTAEQVYGACSDFIVTDEEWALLSPDQRRRVNGYILKIALGEAGRSLVSSSPTGSQERPDTCLTRVPMLVDEEGWTELARMHSAFYLRVMETRGRIEERLADGASEPFRATSLIACFEVSPPS